MAKAKGMPKQPRRPKIKSFLLPDEGDWEIAIYEDNGCLPGKSDKQIVSLMDKLANMALFAPELVIRTKYSYVYEVVYAGLHYLLDWELGAGALSIMEPPSKKSYRELAEAPLRKKRRK